MITADTVLIEIENLTYKEVVKMECEKTAVLCTNALVSCLYLNFKSRLMYIPSTNKQHKQNQDELYAKIYNDFTGRNQQDLAVKYGISAQYIYRIIKREKDDYVKKRQKDIFPQDLHDEDKRPITLMVLEEYLPTEFIHCGLKAQEAKDLSDKIATHLCQTFPGVSICISEAIKNKRNNKNQTSLF